MNALKALAFALAILAAVFVVMLVAMGIGAAVAGPGTSRITPVFAGLAVVDLLAVITGALVFARVTAKLALTSAFRALVLVAFAVAEIGVLALVAMVTLVAFNR